LAVGAFGGRADIMATYDPTRPGAIVHSGTYNGNAATMAAGLKTLELFDREAVARLNRAGDDLRARLNETLTAAGIDGIVAGTGSVLQLHFMAPPLRNARDANRGDRRLLRLMHLSLLNRGVFAAARQMYVLSTAMTPETVDQFVRHFAAALQPIAEAAKQTDSMAEAR
jgi:glutamate-1-semialdehyde 2,1-aminomutase